MVVGGEFVGNLVQDDDGHGGTTLCGWCGFGCCRGRTSSTNSSNT